MTQGLLRYVVAWLSFCLLAVIIAVREVRPRWRDELAFLTVPWKLAVFLPAIGFVTFAGRFTDDETWDVVTGAGMAVLTFLTSGWSLGTLFKVARGQRRPTHAVVALALVFFSSSWFYDGYLLLRDGAYTSRWWSNLMLSPIIYVAAGLLLNVEADGRGVRWAFTRDDWPRPTSNQVSAGMVALAVPLVLVAAYVLVAFVRWSL